VEGRGLQTGAKWADGRWAVVVGRILPAPAPDAVTLDPGSTASVAFAVWEGSNQERAGLHSCSRDWRPLEIE
jgi:DMSO reductase family type II enzyme heme b subunit